MVVRKAEDAGGLAPAKERQRGGQPKDAAGKLNYNLVKILGVSDEWYVLIDGHNFEGFKVFHIETGKFAVKTLARVSFSAYLKHTRRACLSGMLLASGLYGGPAHRNRRPPERHG